MVDSGRLINDNALRREKKQLYLCGTYPNQYYSNSPCPSQQVCPNGGRYLNIGCSSAAQCTPYYSGKSTCINRCCCTVVESTTDTAHFGVCPSAQLSEVVCNKKSMCQSKETCMTGLCCTMTGNEWNLACGGLAALGSCNTAGQCPSGQFCSSSNYCCECPVGRSAGRCQNGVCPSGFSCASNGFCCASCPGNVMPYGACRNGTCGGRKRCSAGNICC
ncbi:hypothetical protein WR25_22548 [Diploscapter pachys]|uniref:Uncharacterized protein n=1 Tax=Diploscapter pachys TaxID=2018661 RepID=A0A2A2JXX2_9BILA|nr:hypothetical protein WR25_22548 [Diploscapter pachys]